MSRFVEATRYSNSQDSGFIDASKIVTLERRRQPDGDLLWLATMDNAMTFHLSEWVGDTLLKDALRASGEPKSATEIARLKKEAAG